VKRDLLDITDLAPEEIAGLLDLAARLKAGGSAAAGDPLKGKTLGLLFEKPSTRTRISFEVAMNQLGGAALSLDPGNSQMGRGEGIADTARTLSRYVDGIMVRTFAHATLLEWARHATVPVINGLTDLAHPCQALADLLTVREHFGRLKGITLAFVGDGNNVAHSLMLAGARTGMHVRVATPSGYAPRPQVTSRAREDAARHGGSVTLSADPKEAARGAHVLYTDVWTSMGQEESRAARLKDFGGFQVDAALLAQAASDAVFMHCLPAHRGEEVSAEVMDGPRSVVFDQAENRLHVQKAVLVRLLAPGPGEASATPPQPTQGT
jgi:ornithine carbamoyltransferase